MRTITLSAEGIERTIEKNDMVLIDFWASWCGTRQQVAPIYEQVAAANADVVFGKVDTEAEAALAAAAQITSNPAVMALKGGELVFSQPGALPAAAWSQVIDAVRTFETPASPESEPFTTPRSA